MAPVPGSSEKTEESHVAPPAEDWWYFEPEPRFDDEGRRVDPGREGLRCPKTGALIKQARKKKGLSQEKLAALIGMSRESVRVMEKGESVPYTGTFLKLEDVLGVPMSSLMDREEILEDGHDSSARKSRSGTARKAKES